MSKPKRLGLAIVLPPNIKRGIRVFHWKIPMVLDSIDMVEYIFERDEADFYIKDKTFAYTKYEKAPVMLDVEGRAIKFKIVADRDSRIEIPLKEVVTQFLMRTKLNEQELKVNVDDTSIYDFLQLVFNSLDVDRKRKISMPDQWLIYDVRNNILSRIAFISSFTGKVTVYTGCENNVLIAVEGNVEYPFKDQYSFRNLKTHTKFIDRIRETWSRMLSEIEEEEIALEFGWVTERKPESRESSRTSKEGEVELEK